MFDSLKLSDLPKKQSYVLRSPSSTRPTIWVVEENGRRVVVKDYSTNKFFFRHTVGRFLVWRERKAYNTLKGLRGVPHIHGVIDGLALIIEQIPGRDLKKATKEMRIPETFLEALNDLVDDLHKRGIAHCDLKKATNILMGKDGLPYIIDWGASISEREFRFPPFNRIYKRFVLDDQMAVIKLKRRYVSQMVTPAENKRYKDRDKAERHIRMIRDRLRRILQKLA